MWRADDPGGFLHWTEVGAAPAGSLRVVSRNLRATPARKLESLMPLISLLGSQEPDVLLLQECRAGWVDLICQELDLHGVSTHELLEATPGRLTGARLPVRIRSALPVRERLFSPAAIERLVGADTPPGYGIYRTSC